MGSQSKGATTSVSSNAPPPEVMQEYEKIIARANEVGAQPYQQYGGQMVAPMSAEQLGAIGTINQTQGLAQPYFDTAQGYLTQGAAPISSYDINRFQNPYQEQVVGATLANLNKLNQQQQAGLEGGLMGSGGLFNDRLGVAQAQLAGQQATSEAPTIAGLEASGYSQALQAAQSEKMRELGAASSEAGLGTANLADILQGAQARYGAGTAEQALAQRYLDVPYQFFQQQQAFPYQQLSWLANIGTGVGSNMGGQSTTTTTPPKPWYQFWKDGGGIKGYDDGGGVDDSGGDPTGLIPYSVPRGSRISSYIPSGIALTHGPGPPKPAAAAQTKAQNPLGDLMKVGDATGLSKQASSMFKSGLSGLGDPSLDEVTQAGAEAGLSPEELGLTAEGGDLLAGAGAADAAGAAGGAAAAEGGLDLGALFALFALAKGGGINLRGKYADGGDPSDDNSPEVPSEAPTGAGLAPLAAAPLSTPRSGLPASLASLDPYGTAAQPAGPALWPGETALPAKPSSPYPGVAGRVADQWREAGAKENAIKGVLYNINAESGFKPDLRHPDQPRFTGEAHYAHGLYQHGGNQWYGLDRYTQQNDQDWRDPHAQTAYEIANLQRTNPDVWRRMNEAPTWQEAAKIYAKWLAPKQEYLDQRIANIDRSTDPLHGYTGAVPTGAGGGDRLPAGATPATDLDGGLHLRTSSDGEGNVTGQSTRGLGRFFTPENALRFGLAMLANPTPYIGTAIGQAGLATLGASTEAERYGAKQAQEERKFKLDSTYKNAAIARMDKQIELAHERQSALEARTSEYLRRGQDATEKQAAATQAAAAAAARKEKTDRYGALSPGERWKQDPTTGEPDPSLGAEPIPGSSKDPAMAGAMAVAKKTSGGEDLLDDVTLKRTAAQYNLLGGAALTNLGRGAQSAAILKQVRTEAAHQDEEAGISPEQRVQIQAQTLGRRAAERTLSTMESKMGTAGFEAEGAIKLSRPIIAKVDASRTGFLPFNRLIVGFKNNTLDPDQRELATRLQGVSNTYAAVMSRGANITTDAARHRGDEMLDSALNAESLNRVLDTMLSEIDMARNSPDQMREFYMNKYGKKAVEGGTAGAGGAGAAGGAGGTTDPLAEARAAIAAGKPRDKVIQRLREHGIDPTGL